jgi:hypothetical protein
MSSRLRSGLRATRGQTSSPAHDVIKQTTMALSRILEAAAALQRHPGANLPVSVLETTLLATRTLGGILFHGSAGSVCRRLQPPVLR